MSGPSVGALLPCPFCGGAARQMFNATFNDMSMVECVSCGACAYIKKWSKRAELLSQVEKAEAVGVLNIWRFRGIDSMVNHDFDYLGELLDGTYSLYLHPPHPPTG